MTKRNALINLTLVFGIWFCLAFSCSSGTRKTTSTGETTQPTTRTTGSGAPTEQDVKDAIKQHQEDGMGNQYTNLVITYDSPIRIGSGTRFNDPEIGWIVVYPTTVDYTVRKEDGFAKSTWHYSGGTIDFYRNTLRQGQWAIGETMGQKSSQEYQVK